MPAVAATTEDLRCSLWTRDQGVDPIGSAPRFDSLLLVEWPLPWPKDIGEIEALAAAAADPRAMVMAVVPQAGPEVVEGSVRVVHHRRIGTHRFAGTDHCVPRDAVPDLLARILADVDGDHLDWPTALGRSPADVLVCGHGRRDPCCGRWGTLLHIELAVRHPEARVWRCSHTGGHRFAPTAITLADGRAWAYADTDLLLGVLGRSVPVSDLHGHDRGTAALGLWGQAVERAVFEQVGWSWLDVDLDEAGTVVGDDGRSAVVRLRWHDPAGGEHQAEGTVAVTREVPVLVCGAPLEAARKSSFEVAVTALVFDGTAVPVRPVIVDPGR